MPIAGQLLNFAAPATTSGAASLYKMLLQFVAEPGLEANRLQHLTGN